VSVVCEPAKDIKQSPTEKNFCSQNVNNQEERLCNPWSAHSGKPLPTASIQLEATVLMANYNKGIARHATFSRLEELSSIHPADWAILSAAGASNADANRT
jgi:hypothetical protein